MKNFFLVSIVVAGFFFTCINAEGQDMLKTNPKEIQLLQDTLGVRMLMLTIPPGGTLEKHSHPVFMFYILQGGTLEFTFEDGRKETTEFKSGTSAKASPLGPHADKNTSTTTIKILFIEFTGKH